jgi:hypothetical protein
MTINIRNEKLEQLAEELAHLTGESTTAAILRALEERRERMTMTTPQEKRTMPEVLQILEKEVWPYVPQKLLGRGVTKKERERILGYGRGGV